MSTTQIQYGIRNFDLSVVRESEEDFERIPLRSGKFVTLLSVPAECYFHLGNPTSPGIDLRDVESLDLSGTGVKEVYLSNPSGVSGTVTVLTGMNVEARKEPNIGDVESIKNRVGVDVEAFSDLATYSDRQTTTGNTASVSPGADGPAVEIVADTSGSATLTVEVSQDGGTNWDSYTVSIADASGHKETVRGFADVRASVNQNLNALSISAKGV